jgi:hypothetical protein
MALTQLMIHDPRELPLARGGLGGIALPANDFQCSA